MLNDHDFALELVKVLRLDFTDQAILSINKSFVLVELSPRLVTVLPQHLRALTIRREDFSVPYVIQEYEAQVVDHLICTTDIATEMLRSAKAQ